MANELSGENSSALHNLGESFMEEGNCKGFRIPMVEYRPLDPHPLLIILIAILVCAIGTWLVNGLVQ